MPTAGPYGITQFDAPGIIGAYQDAQQNRIRMMYAQKEIEKLDAEAKRTATTAAAWSKVVGKPPASKAVDAYGAPQAATTPVAPSAPVDPLAPPPLPDAQPSPTAPAVAPAGSADSPLGQINQQAVPELLSALGPEAGTQFLQHWQQLDDAKKKAVADHNEEIGQALAWADTPEKWDQAVDVLSRQNPQLAQYKGHFDQRDKAALEVGAISSFVKASKPDLMTVDHSVIDKNHPDKGALFTAPTDYHEFTVSNADGTTTPYGFDPKTGRTFQLRDGGGPASDAGGAPGGFDHAVEHVLANEGGYNPSDMNGAPVNFGINQKANPGVDVQHMTKDQARQIYHDKYWVPSGAESLPANLQAPYFDVYIRNPAFAKKALAESGGDAGKFMQASSAYFQKLAQKPNGQRYAHAWAARDAKNTAIATGGTASEGGTPITGKGGGALSDEAAKLAAAIYKTKGTLPAGIARTKGDIDKIMNAAARMSIDEAHQVADQTVGTWQNTKSAQETLTAFSKGKQADTTRSLNVAIQHIDLLRQAATALQNGNIPLFNSVSQHIAQATGHVAPTNFDSLKQLVSDEVVKGVVGTAAGVGDRAEAGHAVGRAASPQQLLGVFDNWQNLMAGQAQGLQKQYEAGTGRKDYADKYLLPRTRHLLLKQEGEGDGWITTKSGLRIRKVN